MATPGAAEIEVKGSRFRAVCLSAPTLAEGLAALEAFAHRERKATHVCWALRAPEAPGGPDVCRSHDAGEPSGTAGRPILAALEESRVTGTLVAVARTFGGVKLGAGGLKRAYHRAALDALRGAVLSTPEPPRVRVRLVLPYARLDQVKRLVERFGGQAGAPACADRVTVDVAMPPDRLADLRSEMAGLSGVELHG